ncbi:MAG: DUF1273 family protein [Clostridia bacterium]|nr:DUF1273 family protein [Clostridia bacterium]
MEKERTCCFTGHRIVGNDLNVETLRRCLRYLANEKNVTTFIAGGALGFDTIVAKEILKLKGELPHIQLHIYAPCKNQDARWSFAQKLEYKSILKKADFVDIPECDYYEGCMKSRNFKMVDSSAFLVAYLNNMRSGTGQTYSYAKRCGLTIFNLAGKN